MVSVPDVGRRTYIALLAALALSGVCGWALAALLIDESPGFALVWLTLTVAVLLPSAAPMVATFTALRRAVAGTAHACWGTAAFVAGYAAAWAAAGCVAWLLATVTADLGWDRWGATVAFALAAAYQLTSVKDRCLANCRVPLSFLMSSWRDGVAGAFDMGAEYGWRCIGVGALLVASLFAHGTAHLPAMALVAALIAVEKLAPSRTLARRGVAGALLALAAVSALAPAALPWL